MKKTPDNRRVSRFEREILQITAKYLQQSSRLRFQSLVAVVRVMMPADLRTAKIYVSVFGPENKPDDVIEQLNENAVFVQNEIAKQLSTRYCPKVRFYLDETSEKILQVEKSLQEIARNSGRAKIRDADELGDDSDLGFGSDSEIDSDGENEP